MPTSVKVSVALCTHNGEQFITEQLASILEQSRPPAEIVLSDDASSDSTVQQARNAFDAFSRRNPKSQIVFTIVRNPSPLGVAMNFERAIARCRSGLVALSDQDDRWVPDKLERMSAVFARRPELLLVGSDAALVDEQGRGVGTTLFEALEMPGSILRDIHDGQAFEALLRRNFVTGATVVLRRELAELATPFPPGWLHDEWLAIVAAATGEIDLIPWPLIDYRQHERNQVGATRLSALGKVRRVLEPGVERNQRLLQRAMSLLDRFEVMEAVPRERVEAVRDKLQHERVRHDLRPHRLSRIRSVVSELRSGRYARFGRGLPDAVRDLLQPLKARG